MRMVIPALVGWILLASASPLQAQTADEVYRIEFPTRSTPEDVERLVGGLNRLLDDQYPVGFDIGTGDVWVGDFQNRTSAAYVLRQLRLLGFGSPTIVAVDAQSVQDERVAGQQETGASAGPEELDRTTLANDRLGSAEAARRVEPSMQPMTASRIAGLDGTSSGQGRPLASPVSRQRRRVDVGRMLPTRQVARSSDSAASVKSISPKPVKKLLATPPPSKIDEARAPSTVDASRPVQRLPGASGPLQEPTTASGPPASATSVATPSAPVREASAPRAEAAYEGFHGRTTCQESFGWIWNPDRPAERLFVEFYEDDRLIGRTVAELDRADLADAGKGDGRYGFRFSFANLDGPPPSSLTARVAGTSTLLPGTPRANPCVSPVDRSESVGRGRPASARSSEPIPLSNVVRQPGAKRALATAIETGGIRLDGHLDESVWRRGNVISDFQQRGLDQGFERPEWTEVIILYDAEALYVGARMSGPDSISPDTRLTRRDEAGNAERLLVSLDTYGDRRTAYTFGVTAGGVRIDHFHPQDRESPRDDSYDPVWETATAVDSAGWTAEMRIPFSQLRMGDTPTQVWGLNLRRWNPATFMNLYWIVIPMAEQGWASRFGDLAGLEGVVPRDRLEVTPYLLTSTTRPVGLPDDGLDSDPPVVTRLGGDLKYGVGPNFTVDATFNPDFGQVEADPAEVNLTAFETQFRERRPFFVAGQNLFQGQGPRYFYSRRVGAIPYGTDPGGSAELPRNSDIYSAVKLTGRSNEGLSVGALAALTSPEAATISDESGLPATQDVAPATIFFAGRSQQELRNDGSTVGLTLTAVRRVIDSGSILETILATQAFAGGADWNLRFGQGHYELNGHAGASYLSGTAEALRWIQRSSVHYFQRPDADHIDFDPDRTSLGGYTGGLSLSKLGGRHWSWTLAGGAESPGFNIRDAGILRAADHADVFGSVRFRQPSPGKIFQWYWISVQTTGSWNFGGTRQFLSPELQGAFTFRSLRRANVRLAYEAPALSDELTRGGPLMRTPSAFSGSLGLASPFRDRNQWSVDFDARKDANGGWWLTANAGVSVRLGPHVLASLHPGYSRSLDTRHYYGSLPGGPELTFDTRQIFSSLKRSEIYAQFRLDLAFTPDLTLQLYVEPFASSGDFHSYGELTAAGSDSLSMYGQDGGTTLEAGEYGSFVVRDGADVFSIWPTDFNVRSFRSNTVLRWEWARGSALHLIWQQSRWGWDDRPNLVSVGAMADAFGDPGENVFVAKVSYWLGLR